MQQSPVRWALVTGASSGLGAAFASALAARGTNLVLTARREEPMRALATQLGSAHGVEVAVEPLDLAAPGGAAALQERLDGRGIGPDILVNNAGFGLAGAFLDHDPGRMREMLQLDIVALTELTHLFGRRMAERGRGHVLLVASLAAGQPCPNLAAYAAAKAYVLSFGEALHVELAPRVGVTVLSPGLMETGFFAAANYHPPASMRRSMLTPDAVAAIGLDAMLAGKPSVIAGGLNKLLAFSNRFTSRGFQARTVLRMSGT